MDETSGARLEVRGDGVYLILEQAENKPKPSRKDVMKLIESASVAELDINAIGEAFNQTEARVEVKISSVTKVKADDERIFIEVSKNKMSATIKFQEASPLGKKADLPAIERAVEQAGVRFGVDSDLLQSLANSREYDFPYRFAVGVEPVNGENGSLEYKFDTGEKSNRPKILEDGRVDYKQIDFFESATEGQLLAVLKPATSGNDGTNVLGQTAAHKPGKPAPKLPGGKGTRVSEDGLQLIAAIGGKVVLANKNVSVLPILEIKGDVGNETGNVNFDGSVVIGGHVLAGFKVKATGNVDVKEAVEGAFIEAGGDISLMNGIHGGDKAVITAGGSIFTKYAQNCTLNCGGSIVSDNILHCIVNCQGSIKLEGRRRLIVGGVLRVGKEIHASVIGSNMATPTDIGICNRPEAIQQFADLRAARAKAEKDYNNFSLAIDNIMKTADIKLLPKDKKDMLLKSLNTKAFLREKMSELQTQINELLETFVGNKGRVVVSGVIHCGVDVLIGDATMHIKDDTESCILQNIDGQIIIGTYRETAA